MLPAKTFAIQLHVIILKLLADKIKFFEASQGIHAKDN